MTPLNDTPADRRRSRACHDCSCHIAPPCFACTNCNHWDGVGDDCPHDCQDCAGHRG